MFSINKYSREQLLMLAKLTAEDLEEIEQRRRDHNRLDSAYQLAFVRVYNHFPTQRPFFEIDDELLTFVGIQLDISEVRQAILAFPESLPAE